MHNFKFTYVYVKYTYLAASLLLVGRGGASRVTRGVKIFFAVIDGKGFRLRVRLYF